MKLNLGYLKQFSRLFGLKHGFRLYCNIRQGKTDLISLPNIKKTLKLRPESSDLRTFYQVFINGEYDIAFPFTPKVIIDGGANIGLFSILMKNKFPDSQIIAIEPDIENFEVLTKNLAGYNSISLENKGIWHSETRLKVYDKYDSGKWAMVVEEDKEGSVDSISINSILENYSLSRIDILKLDIETSEKLVFSKNFEDWLPKTKMIIIELHDWMEEGCSKPFFVAINKSIKSYQYLSSGENTIIINNDLT